MSDNTNIIYVLTNFKSREFQLNLTGVEFHAACVRWRALHLVNEHMAVLWTSTFFVSTMQLELTDKIPSFNDVNLSREKSQWGWCNSLNPFGSDAAIFGMTHPGVSTIFSFSWNIEKPWYSVPPFCNLDLSYLIVGSWVFASKSSTLSFPV